MISFFRESDMTWMDDMNSYNPIEVIIPIEITVVVYMSMSVRSSNA